MIIWNPWHDYYKVSEGCKHCYMEFIAGQSSKADCNENGDNVVIARLHTSV